jgi:hypothetical protein
LNEYIVARQKKKAQDLELQKKDLSIERIREKIKK